MNKNQHGFGIVGILLVLLVVGVISGGGWYVYSMNNKKEVKESVQPVAPEPKTEAVNTIPEGFTEYTNNEIGVKFNYPQEWGDVTATKDDSGQSGHYYVVSFSKEASVKAGVISSDFEEGKDGSCYVRLGIYPNQTLEIIKNNEKLRLNNVNASDLGSPYGTTGNILKDTSDTFISESFEAGVPDGVGACTGLYLTGYKAIESNKNYRGIEFFWREPGDNETDYSELAIYKANPNKYLSEKDRQNFITTVESAVKN